MVKKKNKKRIIILSIVLVVVVVAVFGYIRMRNNAAEAQKTTYEIIGVERGTIEVKVKGAGSVEPLYDDTEYAPSACTVEAVLAENGDNVAAGDIIVMLDSVELEKEMDMLGQQIDDIDTVIAALRKTEGSEYIKSPVEGTVKMLYAQYGDSVDAVMNAYGALAVICPDNVMQAAFSYAGDIALGQHVTVKAGTDSVDGVIYSIDALVNEATVRFSDTEVAPGETAMVFNADGDELGSGFIGIANPIYVTGRGGIVSKVYKDAGSSISRDGKLFRLTGQRLSPELYAQITQRSRLEKDLGDVIEKLDALAVRAGRDGIVSELALGQGQAVQSGAKLFSIESSEQVKIDVDIDELDIADIEIGQNAAVMFDAIPDKEFTAKVARINPVGVSENNVTHYTVTLELIGAKDVMLGMSADVEIVSEVAQNVLMIPIEAIQVIGLEKFVVFEQDIDKALAYTPATHQIVTGITDGVNIEVLQGLSEGDRVAIPKVKRPSLQEQMWKYRNNNVMHGNLE
ncbi:MAG: HlyD family efflux transporter periplasmic adaptor subunit [Christensenellales bacterium]